MPSYERELDLVQGYNFKKDVQKPIGFITSLTIGDAPILADQTVSTPITNVGKYGGDQIDLDQGSLAVVSVLKKIKWDLGDTDPIEFEGTLSVNGKQIVMGQLYATMINVQVKIGYVIYEYDPINRQYFVAFSNTVSGGGSDATAGSYLSALVRKDGDNLALTVAPTPSADVQSPENYDFTLQVVPLPVPQKLFLAAASTRRVTKYWGRQGPGGKTL